MTKPLAQALLLAIINIAFVHAAEPPSDDEIRRLIVGKWREEIVPVWGHLTIDTTYRDDGTFESVRTSRRHGREPTKSVLLGSWKVSDGKVTESYDKPPNPAFPMHKTRQLAVVEIVDRTLVQFRVVPSTLIDTMKRVVDGDATVP